MRGQGATPWWRREGHEDLCTGLAVARSAGPLSTSTATAGREFVRNGSQVRVAVVSLATATAPTVLSLLHRFAAALVRVGLLSLSPALLEISASSLSSLSLRVCVSTPRRSSGVCRRPVFFRLLTIGHYLTIFVIL